MRLIPVDPLQPDPSAMARAGEILRAGGLVAFPTETVYGLGANALDTAAVAGIFRAKGRPASIPLIVHVPDEQAARRLVRRFPPAARRLAEAFWPGPLTLVLEKRAIVPDIVTGGLPSVGVRVPAHPIALALLRAAAVPVAAPSANRFTGVSPTTAQHVVKELGDAVDLVLDGGSTPFGIESTVIDLTVDPPRLLRPGGVSAELLDSVVGPVARPLPTTARAWPLPSPGMTPRHYAPRARVRLFRAEERDAARDEAGRARHAGSRVGAMAFRSLDAAVDHEVLMPARPDAYAERLYAALHALDDLGCDVILVEAAPAEPEWLAVRDRLWRAATPESG